ncbi:acetylornithine transaminase [uncultured Jatrophihabitans sp.]|uniref:acetylornithine transaminase n=1 Tax=uncultured Jatrophihabitans sp. TaxID=1610747 RepID=UPI0035CA8AC1
MTLTERWNTVMMDNYGTPKVALDHGDGVRVWSTAGDEFLDFVGGIAVSSLGHAHPAIVAAVTDQVGRLAHTSNLAMHEPGVRLAERLVDLLGLPARVFFANSGAEANECALKLARKHRPGGGIVSCNASFHGRTFGALSVTGNAAKREPFAPLPGPVTFVDYGDTAALRAAVTRQTAAVIVEPTLGEGGIVAPPPGFLTDVRAICDDAGALLIVDEVQSGIGRTGNWFASQAEGVRPDVVTLAKGLGGGLPIGACLAVGAAGELFAPGDHGSTFGGNPVSCAAALAVLTTIADEHLLDHVKQVGEHLARRIEAIGAPLVREVRGSGLWRGVVLTGAHAADVELSAFNRGLLVNAVRPDVLRLAPPLITTTDDVDTAVVRLADALQEVAARDA